MKALGFTYLKVPPFQAIAFNIDSTCIPRLCTEEHFLESDGKMKPTSDGRREALLSPRRRGRAVRAVLLGGGCFKAPPPRFNAPNLSTKTKTPVFKRWFQLGACTPLHRGESHASFLLHLPPTNDAPKVGRCKLSCRSVESAPRFNARNRSMKTPVSNAGFNWELAPLYQGRAPVRVVQRSH